MLKNPNSKKIQKTTKKLVNEVYSKGAKRNYNTNKPEVFYIDDSWSLDILDFKDCGPENIRGYRFLLVNTDNF